MVSFKSDSLDKPRLLDRIKQMVPTALKKAEPAPPLEEEKPEPKKVEELPVIKDVVKPVAKGAKPTTPVKKKRLEPSFLENVAIPFFENHTPIERVLDFGTASIPKKFRKTFQTYSNCKQLSQLDQQSEASFELVLCHDILSHKIKGQKAITEAISQIEQCLVPGQHLMVSWKADSDSSEYEEAFAQTFDPGFFAPVGGDRYTHTDGYHYRFYRNAQS